MLMKLTTTDTIEESADPQLAACLSIDPFFPVSEGLIEFLATPVNSTEQRTKKIAIIHGVYGLLLFFI